ncbi:MAG: division/cell wall cluster transcriptional repressor MraZ [Ectothiorhodospiraceae bacterium AqS1]|nr:division/cell wall cluster transcriptional repressor MraZ [Ectothiorhodospiraceae bacterium AqS1]
MFRGQYPLTMDAKGRIAIPARYRAQLEADGGQVITTVDLYQRCIAVYPFAVWEPIEGSLNNVPVADLVGQKLRRRLVGRAVDCDLDAQGRILLSAELRQYAGLEKRVQMVGLGKKFELWDEGRLHLYRRDEQEDPEQAVNLGQEELSAHSLLGTLPL